MKFISFDQKILETGLSFHTYMTVTTSVVLNFNKEIYNFWRSEGCRIEKLFFGAVMEC